MNQLNIAVFHSHLK